MTKQKNFVVRLKNEKRKYVREKSKVENRRRW